MDTMCTFEKVKNSKHNVPSLQGAPVPSNPYCFMRKVRKTHNSYQRIAQAEGLADQESYFTLYNRAAKHLNMPQAGLPQMGVAERDTLYRLMIRWVLFNQSRFSFIIARIVPRLIFSSVVINEHIPDSCSQDGSLSKKFLLFYHYSFIHSLNSVIFNLYREAKGN